MYRGLMNNRGVLRCNEPLHLPGQVNAARPILFTDGDASISRVQFTPNRIDFGVTTRGAPARVFMNQRYVAGWRSTAGPIEIDAGDADCPTSPFRRWLPVRIRSPSRRRGSWRV